MKFADNRKDDRDLKRLLMIFIVLIILVIVIPIKNPMPPEQAEVYNAKQRRIQDSVIKRESGINYPDPIIKYLKKHI